MDEFLSLASDRQTTMGLILVIFGIIFVLNAIGLFKFSAIFFSRDLDTLFAFVLFGIGMATIYNDSN